MKENAILPHEHLSASHSEQTAQDGPFKSVCPVHRALVLVGDKWTLLLIRDLFFRHSRYYGDFLKGPEKISSNILASRLQRLEAEGIVIKKSIPDEPSRSGYYPTAKAIGLVPVIVEMMIWADQHYPAKSAYQPASWVALKEKLVVDKPAAIEQLMTALMVQL